MTDNELTTDAVTKTLAFFRSVIRSGEPWTVQCEEEYEAAILAHTAATADRERMVQALETLRNRVVSMFVAGVLKCDATAENLLRDACDAARAALASTGAGEGE